MNSTLINKVPPNRHIMHLIPETEHRCKECLRKFESSSRTAIRCPECRKAHSRMRNKMVTKQYKPQMFPVIEHAGPNRIRCSQEYINSLKIENKGEQQVLEDAVVESSVCPKIWWFRDSKLVRQILKVPIANAPKRKT